MKPSKAFKMGVSIIDKPIDKVLFLGCGTGRNMYGIEANECIGVDFSEEAVKRARKIAEKKDSDNVKIAESNVENWLDNCDDEFDLIVDSYFSYHFSLDKFSSLRDKIKTVSSKNSLYFWSGMGLCRL